jgi:hypothetical protein
MIIKRDFKSFKILAMSCKISKKIFKNVEKIDMKLLWKDLI